MKTKRTVVLTTILLFSCCLVFAARGLGAEPQAAAKDKIKELQKQRLDAALLARSEVVKEWKKDTAVVEVTGYGFINELLEVHRLVLRSRLDLCDTKADRINAIEKSIKEFEPVVATFAKHIEQQVWHGDGAYRLSQVQMLDFKIALERAKQE